MNELHVAYLKGFISKMAAWGGYRNTRTQDTVTGDPVSRLPNDETMPAPADPVKDWDYDTSVNRAADVTNQVYFPPATPKSMTKESPKASGTDRKVEGDSATFDPGGGHRAGPMRGPISIQPPSIL